MPSFQDGSFYVQDPSTLLAPTLLDPKPGETVLDFCAAPGGKTTFMAQQMRNEGTLVARDIDLKRLELVKENCGRLGVKNVSFEIPDARQFDAGLLDAPCSNTGVMRRRVELRWRITPEEIVRLAGLQLKLLTQMAEKIRPGGRLVYSTCSIEFEENQSVIAKFISAHPDFKLLEEKQLTPLYGVDGAYAAKLVRS